MASVDLVPAFGARREGVSGRVRECLTAAELHRLALAIRATLGIEAFVWLTDVAGLSRDDAVDLMRSSARALLRSALAENASADGAA